MVHNDVTIFILLPNNYETKWDLILAQTNSKFRELIIICIAWKKKLLKKSHLEVAILCSILIQAPIDLPDR